MVFQPDQRYNFESKSQHEKGRIPSSGGCFSLIKGTILKANHNTNASLSLVVSGVSA